MAIKLPEYTTNALQCVPSAALGVSVTQSGVAWTNTGWTELITSTSGAIVIAGVTMNPATACDFEIDIGTGAAGSEVAIASLAGSIKSLINSDWFMPFPILIDNVPASTRVAVRMRNSGTGVNTFRYALLYYNKPLGGNLTTTANAALTVPTAANMISLTPSATPWANGAYAAITTGLASAIVLGAVAIAPGTATDWEVDISTGASGAEVVVTTLRGHAGTVTGGPWYFELENPLDNIAASTRIAARVRTSGTTTTAFKVKLIYYNKPL